MLQGRLLNCQVVNRSGHPTIPWPQIVGISDCLIHNYNNKITIMKSSVHIDIPYMKIAEFCQKWKIREFSLFGSVLRRDFSAESDIDVLVTFEPEAKYGLFDIVHMQNELKRIFGREVDLLSRRGIETSRNYIRRKAILSSAEVIHAAR